MGCCEAMRCKHDTAVPLKCTNQRGEQVLGCALHLQHPQYTQTPSAPLLPSSLPHLGKVLLENIRYPLEKLPPDTSFTIPMNHCTPRLEYLLLNPGSTVNR